MNHTEVRTSMQAIFEVRTSILINMYKIRQFEMVRTIRSTLIVLGD